MGLFGEHLRRERETRGISLDEIVATTKIGRRLLTALEQEQFDLLPGGIFNKSYVRAYAKCVGIDEDEAVAAYLEASQEAAPDTKVIAQQHASIHSSPPRDHFTFPVVPVLILVVVAAGAVGGWKIFRNYQRERALRTAVNSAQASPAAASTRGPDAVRSEPASVQTTPQASSVAPPASAKTPKVQAAAVASPPTAGNSFEVTVRPKGPAWVSIKSDGKYVLRGIIRPPDSKTVRASSELVFFTGNAGAVDVAFDGKSVPLSHGANQSETVVFGSQGVMPGTAAQ